MKVFLCLAFLAAAVVAVPVEDPSRINGETGWYVPQWDGSVEWVDKAEGLKKLDQLKMKEGRDVSLWPVDYYLYTRANPTKGQQIKATAKSMDASNFNPKNPTRFVIHGWTQSYTSGMNKDITKAWLSRGDYNVIVVDWARARSLEYASSVIAVDTTGEKVAGFIDFLVKERGMPLSNLIVIGHSLGAHVSGYAGKNVKSGKINTIVGLDPALPLFVYEWSNKRLANTDATYVESIHTNGGGLGFLRPIGKASFYPNGGESQPGCTLDLTGACSHGRSTTYYAEGVELNNFPTIKCANYVDATKNKCGSTYSSVKMATANVNPSTSGEYYVPVKSKSPHGMA